MKNVLYSKTDPRISLPLSIKQLALLCCCFSGLIVTAQENKVAEEPFRPHHAVSILISHTHTAQGSEDGEKAWLTLPSWALDYNYLFSRKWSFGLHSDMILETFKVKEHESDEEEVERTRPIAGVAVVSFKPGRHFSFQLGAGGEFAKESNYFLNRVGVEYGLELPQNWELVGNVIWDLKWHAYNSLSVGIGISKAFGFRRK